MTILMVNWVNEVRDVCSNIHLLLIKPQYAKLKQKDDHELFGLCYTASEAYYHIQKGRGLNVSGAFKKIKWRGQEMTHWVVIHNDTGEVVDITADQFKGEVDLNYSTFTKRGFYPTMSNACALVLKTIRHNCY